MDECTENINVSEICGQIVNFVIENTQKKRTILERVPQSELDQMSSKDRKVQFDEIKKELEGQPFYTLRLKKKRKKKKKIITVADHLRRRVKMQLKSRQVIEISQFNDFSIIGSSPPEILHTL